jgi:hypothetical protein
VVAIDGPASTEGTHHHASREALSGSLDPNRSTALGALRNNVSVDGDLLVTKPDTEGRLLTMIEDVLNNARRRVGVDAARIETSLHAVRRGLAEGSYLAIAPQFVVTAIA